MNTLAILLALGASICWACVMVLVKVGLKRMDFVSFVAIRPLFALVFIVPYGLLTAGFNFSGFDLVGIAVLGGFLDSFVGSLLFFVAIQKIPARKATALSTTAPFWGVVAAVLFLGERPQLIIYVAAILVVVGAYVLSIRREKAFLSNHSALAAFLALAAGILLGGGRDCSRQILPQPWNDTRHLPADRGSHRWSQLGACCCLEEHKTPTSLPMGRPEDRLAYRLP